MSPASGTAVSRLSSGVMRTLISPSLCASFLCVGFMFCPSLWRGRMFPSSSRGTICQLGITTERELPLPHGSSKSLSSCWTSLAHVLFLVPITVGWSALIGPVWEVTSGVSSQRVKGSQRRVKVKRPDGDGNQAENSQMSISEEWGSLPLEPSL